jgi:mono/diheme cytochrome c family protein
MTAWRLRVLSLAALLALASCVRVPPAPPSLPRGAGRVILERECLSCHELDALALFRDYYGRAQWRALILTMRDNGAALDDEQVEVLASYLAQHFGIGGT